MNQCSVIADTLPEVFGLQAFEPEEMDAGEDFSRSGGAAWNCDCGDKELGGMEVGASLS